jgi:hypothetical protein
MTTTMPSTATVVPEPMCSDAERVALAGFLAGYSGLTREAYTLDLRQFAAWCAQHNLGLFEARRVDVECFGRDLEERVRARATVAQRSMSAGRGSTTSRTSPASTATNSALSLWPPGLGQPSSTPSSRCSP